MHTAFERLCGAPRNNRQRIRDIAASFQYNLARGIAALAVRAGERDGIRTVALSGGVAINYAIRETIRTEVERAGLEYMTNPEYPPGDGCVSFGQCVYAGLKSRKD